MHLRSITFNHEKYPAEDVYPFSLEIIKKTSEITFHSPVVFFIGENGCGKSTVLKAIARKCSIHLWKDEGRRTVNHNKYAELLYRYMEAEWVLDKVPGSFFSSEYFRYFAEYLDDWAAADSGMLKYFGGSSLLEKSHGQGNMAYFKSRYALKGLYLLDEPENALSPVKQIELLRIINAAVLTGKAQFIIASHSPILLALPGAEIFSFDHIPVRTVGYKETEHYRVYHSFINNPEGCLNT